MSNRITPPFANYKRIRLERLVLEQFEAIERHSVRSTSPYLNSHDFQLLLAADYYLRNTKNDSNRTPK